VQGYGTITPRPAGAGRMAGSANIAAPIPGQVAKVICEQGQQVKAGEALIQLDDRQAKAAEDQAQATLAEQQAALAVLRATPRPEQLQIAQLAVDKSQFALDGMQKEFDRQTQLAAQQGTSAKALEQATTDLAAAKNDLAVNQKQLELLKASPSPEEVAEVQAKVREAEAALASAKAARGLLTIAAPIDATVMAISVNPGEAVDSTRTLVQLVALDRLMVDVDVPAEELPKDPVGLAAEVFFTTARLKDDAVGLACKVTYVSGQVEAKNGAVMVGIDLPAPSAEHAFRPGQTVRVKMTAEEHKEVLAVPEEAVVKDENGDSVISALDGNQATHKTVTPGLEENGLVEISADGLTAGMKVVTTGAAGLPQSTRVKVEK